MELQHLQDEIDALARKLVHVAVNKVLGEGDEPPTRRRRGPLRRTLLKAAKTAGKKHGRGHRIDWAGVDLTRSPIQIAKELGCSVNSVYVARGRSQVKQVTTEKKIKRVVKKTAKKSKAKK